MLRDSIILLKDVHVVNLTSEKGTFSNDYGQYRIVVSLGDTVQFSSVQYETVKRVITDRIVFSKKLNLILEKKSYTLDEIALRKHDLTGNLLTDRRKVPLDSIAKMRKSMLDLIVEISDKDKEGQAENYDSSQNGLSKLSTQNTDPTRTFKGIGGLIGLGSNNKKKDRLRKITSNVFSTKNLVEDVGEDFFEELKIPAKKIYAFIDYCKQFKIKELYHQKKILDIIQLLKEKSRSYLLENNDK
tara:strand:- start:3406 stop:4134 length:729 start_codon:yes stop_codon:yes gene_type:complete